MSLKKTEQAPPCSLSNKFVTVDPPAKLSDRYILLSPIFFHDSLEADLTFIDSIEVRSEDRKYYDYPEDRYSAYCGGYPFTVDIWQNEHHCEKIVYVPHQGRLYSCNDILEVADLIREVKAAEALKIIPNDQ